ncbi:VapC toxin family PIN domain ribonuclease [Rubrivivax gelatinosus]|uniref:type II toxin-antitoxin system VapC family toxin n=1 Tax=Rubrivivax gelatinosus TaxID=28068 RepID=UPI0019035818|nr:PIN domain nuclease [Rubrivivax gelatinosus]MBK1615743.1 VapC toxin family PIN domain ribonuclease [Rubrivivax gelatinosus]
MILVDSSVWIDFFRGTPSVQAEWLDRHLGLERFAVGDLILAEVLQGFKDERGFDEARRLLGRLEQVEIAGFAVAVEAARLYRQLRAAGVTVRGTVDMLIATRCLVDGLVLLHDDRDFDAFETRLGLQVVDCRV